MIGKFFTGLSKLAKIIFTLGFIIAILVCFIIYSTFLKNDGTNKYDASSVQAQAQAQVEIEKIRQKGYVEEKSTLDVTEAARMEYELKNKQTVDATLKMEREMELEKMKMKAVEEANKAKEAAKARAIKAKLEKEKEEINLLKSLAGQ